MNTIDVNKIKRKGCSHEQPLINRDNLLTLKQAK